MGQLLYATRLKIPSENPEETYWKVLQFYLEWIRDDYISEEGLHIISDDGEIHQDLVPKNHKLDIFYRSGNGPAQIEWSFPDSTDALWKNVIRIAISGKYVHIEHQIFYSRQKYMITPPEMDISAPTIISYLCDHFPVMICQNRAYSATQLVDAVSISDFVNLLLSPNRRVPIVLVTSYNDSRYNLVDTEQMASSLAGVANVFEINNNDATRIMTSMIGQLGCFNGALRIYWPEMSTNDSLARHPLFFSQSIESMGPDSCLERIKQIIFGASALNFSPDPDINNPQPMICSPENINADEKEENQKTETQPRLNVEDIVRKAEIICPYLDILPTALTSARRSPFRRPYAVLETLQSINRVAEIWAKGETDTRLVDMLRAEGLGRRVSPFISETAKQNWGHEYTFPYKGENTLFEWHVSLGSGSALTCLSIHFLPDRSTGKIAIGYVGRHLTNTKS